MMRIITLNLWVIYIIRQRINSNKIEEHFSKIENPKKIENRNDKDSVNLDDFIKTIEEKIIIVWKWTVIYMNLLEVIVKVFH